MRAIQLKNNISLEQYKMAVRVLEAMDIEVENTQIENSFLTESQKQELSKRVENYKENPNIGISFEEVDKKLKVKYGF